jgi:ribosomal protein L40E
MMLGIGGTVGIINSFAFVGLVLAVPLLILVVIGFFFIFRAFLRGRGTKYYLTNERLIEARKGQIVQEISLGKFQGKPLGQFFEKKVIGTVNNQPVYVIKIYDPLSGEALMEFKDLDASSAEALERIGQIVECRYCSFKNPVNSLKCGNCGAPL